MIVIVALLAGQSAQPAPTDHDECRALVDKGALGVAEDCYRHAAAVDDDAALALALAEVLARVRLRQPAFAQPTHRPPSTSLSAVDLTQFALSGRAEVVGLSFLDGIGVGIALAGIATSSIPNNAGAVVVGLGLPLLGGVVGFGAGLSALLTLDGRLSEGDVHLIRGGLVVAVYEGTSAALLAATLSSSSPPSARLVVPSAGLVALGLSVGGVAVAAAFFDVDPSAPSLGLSFGWVGGVLGFLIVKAVDPRGLSAQQASQLPMLATSLGVHAGLVTGLAAAPALGLSRPAMLLIDGGGLVGLLGGSALAFGLNAPNPLLGYGTIATATVLGAAVGVVGAVLVPQAGAWLAAVQVVPTVVGGDRSLVPGLGVLVALP